MAKRPASGYTDEDEALLGELGIEVEAKSASAHTAREERIIAGFEDIQRFVEQHARPPRHGEDRDIFERIYAVRLDRLRDLDECRVVLEPLDHQALLKREPAAAAADPEDLDDDALLARLGVETGPPPDMTELRHVRSASEKRAAEEIANREKCEDFDQFKPVFEQVQQDIAAGLRQTRRFERKSEIAPGRFYILGGQKAYIAAAEKPAPNDHGAIDARLRVIFDNGTESNLLMRSLQKALQQNPAGRRIMDPTAGPLFSSQTTDGDAASGIVYVLRSKSDQPDIAAHRGVLHKIGVTGGDVKRRIANARLDPTFLMADVEIVATYELYNMNRSRLEKLIHRVFAPARLDIAVTDRFGQPVIPQEWFLAPLFIIDKVMEMIRDGTITGCIYDPGTANIVAATHQDVRQ